MGARGPLGKPPEQRHGHRKRAVPKPAEAPTRPVQATPRPVPDGPWHHEAIWWWRSWAESDAAQHMTEADWRLFERVLRLQDKYFRLIDEDDPKSLRLAVGVHTEIRLSLARYADLRRLGWDKPIEAPRVVDDDDDATKFMTASIEKWRQRSEGKWA